MKNHRCNSCTSVISVRKWLFESGDGSSTSICISPLRNLHNLQQKAYINKIVKRKRPKHHTYHSNTLSFIDWLYEFIKKTFFINDAKKAECIEQVHYCTIDDTNLSVMTCSTCQLENIDPHRNTIEPALKFSRRNLILKSKSNQNLIISSTKSNCNLNSPQSIILHLSKATQTQTDDHETYSTASPLCCFFLKDVQILPHTLVPPSSSEFISIIREMNSLRSPNNYHDDFKYFTAPSIITDIHTHSSSNCPAVASITSSKSNTISLNTTQNSMKDDTLCKTRHLSSSPCDTSICHFDKANCLIGCYHATNKNTPDIVFAESTCQLIKQAWLSSKSNKQENSILETTRNKCSLV